MKYVVVSHSLRSSQRVRSAAQILQDILNNLVGYEVIAIMPDPTQLDEVLIILRAKS